MEDRRLHVVDFDLNKFCLIVVGENGAANTHHSLGRLETDLELELYDIQDTGTGLGEAFNEIMAESNARYKLYLRSGFEVREPKMLDKMKELFDYEYKCGILGISGAEYIPVNTDILWTQKRFGRVLTQAKEYLWQTPELVAQPVAAVDPFVYATQYDLPFQTDFDSFYYLTLAQCMEFKRLGYDSLVMRQDEAWAYIERF